jgi:DnaK suppressor protein
MNDDQLKKYKASLEKTRAMLFAEIKQTETPPEFGSDVDHFDEDADEAEEVGNQLAIGQDLKNRLAEIDIALGKIQSGGYGICEKGGENIEKEILDIDPESRFCKMHKLEMADAE